MNVPTSSNRRDRLVTIKELADYLRVAPQTIYNWRSTGRGPVGIHLEGGGVRYRWSDVVEWIESQKDVRGMDHPW